MGFLKDYFRFNKRQERGVLVLAVILIITAVINHYAPQWRLKSDSYLNENNIFLDDLQLVKMEDEKSRTNTSKTAKAKIELIVERPFDPNNISTLEMEKIGLPPFVIQNITKYRDRGGVFKSSQDLKRIYGMEEVDFNQLEKWIKIAEQKEPLSSGVKKSKQEIFQAIELTESAKSEEIVDLHFGINNVDSIQLLDISGIGPFYAGAIVEYRKRLGGYVNMIQLMEIYKMDSSRYHQIQPYLYLDSTAVEKININTADFKTILRHPYIDYETTKYIVNKRNKLKKFAALYEIKDEKHLPDSLYNKIVVYLSID